MHVSVFAAAVVIK